MPAIRNTPLKSQSTTPPTSSKAAPGWSKDQKSTLFNHVLKFGEKDWKVAVPGKTGKEVSNVSDVADDSVLNSGSEFWFGLADVRKTLLPYIRRVSGL
jgi:hypothetical protein